MANTGGIACLRCLVVYDPAEMLDVVIDHHAVANPNVFRICRRCGIAVIRAAAKSELIGLEEVFPGVDLSAANYSRADSASSAAEAAPALVSGAQPDSEGPGEHRREPELPPGGARDAGEKQ